MKARTPLTKEQKKIARQEIATILDRVIIDEIGMKFDRENHE